MQDEELRLHAAIEDHHWWFVGRRRIVLDCLLGATRARGCVAEIGCGTGGNLAVFARHFERVLGVDSSATAVNLARARRCGELLLGDFRDVLAGRWAGIDAVALLDVLEHVEDHAAFLGSLVDSLKPGAVLVITVPSDDLPFSVHDRALGHHRRYGCGEVQALLAGRADVEIVHESAFNSLLYPLMRMVRKPDAGGRPGRSDLREHAAIVNGSLRLILEAEAWLLRRGFRFRHGASRLLLLRKRA